MSILVTVINQGWVHKSVCEAIQNVAVDPRPKTIIWPAIVPPYYNALNQVAKLVREGSYEWWLSMDDDNAPTRNPLELIELDKDFIGLPTPIEREGLKWNVFNQDGSEWKDCHGLQQVPLVGSGCFLVHRRVLEKIYNAFFPGYTQEGIRTLGPDMAFCLRAAHAGFKVWTHFDYPCQHIKEVNLLEFL